MGKRTYQNYTILDAKAATGAGTAIRVEDYRHLILWFATDGGGTAALTVKFQISNAINEPDWGSAQSTTNEWDYVDVIPYMTKANTIYYGDDGVAVATADDYQYLQANTDGVKWLNAIVTARTAGSVSIKAKVYSD